MLFLLFTYCSLLPVQSSLSHLPVSLEVSITYCLCVCMCVKKWHTCFKIFWLERIVLFLPITVLARKRVSYGWSTETTAYSSTNKVNHFPNFFSGQDLNFQPSLWQDQRRRRKKTLHLENHFNYYFPIVLYKFMMWFVIKVSRLFRK